MFELALPWWEALLRASLVYLGVLLLLRVLGKRQFGELGPFDVILLLLISEAASNALVVEDYSLTWGFLAIGTMLALDWCIGKLAQRSFPVSRALEGKPRFLLKQGRVFYAVLREEGINPNELRAALRAAGCFTPGEADYAVLETSGTISVRARRDRPQPTERRTLDEVQEERRRAGRRSGGGGGSSAEGSSTGASATRAGARKGGARSGRPPSRPAARKRSA